MLTSTRKDLITRLQPLIALAIMVLGLSLSTKNFFTSENGLIILRQISVNLCLSIGMTLVILTAGIDLSVGAVLGLTGAIAAVLLKNGIVIQKYDLLIQFNVSGAMLAAIIVGATIGCINGTIITRFGVPPFIVTLGMLSATRGMTKLWTHGDSITGLGNAFGSLGNGHWLGIPTPIWVYSVLVIIFVVITRRTRFGRYIYAIGGSERASILSGLPVDRTKIIAYTISGMTAAVAGLIVTSRLDSADPVAGGGYELDSIAAVVIGGTSLAGGRGSIPGTVLGCLIIGVLNSGLNQIGVPPAWQDVAKGAVIVIAVAIDRRR